MTNIAIVTGGYIGQLYNGTVIPLVGGFAGLVCAALLEQRQQNWFELDRLCGQSRRTA